MTPTPFPPKDTPPLPSREQLEHLIAERRKNRDGKAAIVEGIRATTNSLDERGEKLGAQQDDLDAQCEKLAAKALLEDDQAARRELGQKEQQKGQLAREAQHLNSARATLELDRRNAAQELALADEKLQRAERRKLALQLVQHANDFQGHLRAALLAFGEARQLSVEIGGAAERLCSSGFRIGSAVWATDPEFARLLDVPGAGAPAGRFDDHMREALAALLDEPLSEMEA